MKLSDLLEDENERRLLDMMAGIMIGIAPIVHLIVVGGIKIPYGRHTSRSWGPLLNAKVAWFMQVEHKGAIGYCYYTYLRIFLE